MTPEEQARQHIDRLLTAAGWSVQNHKQSNLSASLGVAVREYPTETGPADYVLFVDRQPVGVIEAKAAGKTLSGVAEQTERYLTSTLKYNPKMGNSMRFGYESTGVETFFRDLADPDPRSRRVFAFHRPETLLDELNHLPTLRARLRTLPPLHTNGLRDCQFEAITNLERSFAEGRPRALIQMATGAGKTFTAVNFVYRLIKFAGAKRVLFLVDRNNLGRQTKKEFEQFITPDDGRKFTELYNIQHLRSNTLDPVSKVCITTIQRLYSMLKGEPEFDESLEEQSVFSLGEDGKVKDVAYNPNIPIETFDFIITDECHRSIYNLWRQVLEYFDAFIIGLTATPSKQTLGFFNQNLVMEYSHERAVADGVNVGYDVYSIVTNITQSGSKVDAGYYVDKRNKLSRKVRWEQLDEDLAYTPNQLDRDVVAPDQIRTVIRTFKERLFTEIFPGRTEVPKTLIFAKDDSHAEDIVQIVREEFGRGNDFCKKITYRTTGEKPEDLLASFRNSYNPRIAVTVDMISTGTDIKPLECLLFMRDIRSRTYFEQMKGRGTRTIDETSLATVTPDAKHKTRFVIVDAVGVCRSDKTDSRPLDRNPSVPFEKLLLSVAYGNRDEDTVTSLAARLARLDRELNEKQKEEIESVLRSDVQPNVPVSVSTTRALIGNLFDALDPDKQIEKARELFSPDPSVGAGFEPTEEQLAKAASVLLQQACAPFDHPRLREVLLDVKKQTEQTIDTVSKDTLIYAGADEQAKEKARTIVESFRKFIEENKAEITALQILYSKPYGTRHLTYADIQQLADAIKKPPYHLTPETLWFAYRQLEQAKVRGAGPQKLLTNIISLVRFAIGQTDALEPFPDTVEQRFHRWVREQESLGREFTTEQMEWLEMIKNHIATSVAIQPDDFETTPFYERGGLVKAHQVFGEKLDEVLDELNKVLTGVNGVKEV
jgi:type I restriction enzyme R subunit